MSTEYLSASAILPADGGYEPQRKTNFSLVMNIPGVGQGGRTLALSLDSVGEPKVSVERGEVKFGNQTRKYAGLPTTTIDQIVFKDWVDKDVFNLLWQWWRKVYNARTGKIGSVEDYKVNAHLMKFGPDGDNVRVWELVGVWPSSVSGGTAEMGSSEQNKITVVLEVDEINYEGAAGGSAGGVSGL